MTRLVTQVHTICSNEELHQSKIYSGNLNEVNNTISKNTKFFNDQLICRVFYKISDKGNIDSNYKNKKESEQYKVRNFKSITYLSKNIKAWSS